MSTKRNKTFSIMTLGCKVNQYESEAITEQFINAGYKCVEFEDKADIYLVNTCTVTNVADKKSRKMLSKAKKNNKDAIVAAVGCYVQIAHDQVEEIPFVDILIGNTHKNQVVEIVEKYIREQNRENWIEDVHHNIEYEELTIQNQQNKTRSAVKIQDGCNQYCTYCIIPYTRGKVRSRKPELIINEVKGLGKNGFREIILTGIHIGSYGKDLEGYLLIDLIEELDKIADIRRIRLGSLEPNLITTEFMERLVACKSVCDHFHLSMQSGSDTVLKRMNRRYTSGQYMDKVALIRDYYPNAGITTDVIVGFPMETDSEEEETYRFVENVGFSDLHVFKYSPRKGTVAAGMKPQIDGNVKSRRSRKLVVLGERLKRTFLTRQVGQHHTIIPEEEQSIDKKIYITGYTRNYIKVYLDKDLEVNALIKGQEGQPIKIEIIGLFEDGVYGQVIH